MSWLVFPAVISHTLKSVTLLYLIFLFLWFSGAWPFCLGCISSVPLLSLGPRSTVSTFGAHRGDSLFIREPCRSAMTDGVSERSGWLMSLRQEITSAGEDAERRGPLCAVGGKVHRCLPCRKQHGGSSENENQNYRAIQQAHLWVYLEEARTVF